MAVQRAIFCVKNTFIDTIDAGDGEEQPRFLPRSRTEPFLLSRSWDLTDSGSLPSGADFESDDSPCCVGRGPGTPGGCHAGEPGALTSLEDLAGPALAKRTVRCCVKKTVIADVDDCDDDEQPLFLPLSRTDLVVWQGSMESTDCGSNLSCDDSQTNLAQTGSDEGPRALPARTPFAAATPTPWPDPRKERELCFFPAPIAVQAPPLAAPVTLCAAPLPAQQPTLVPHGAPAGMSISARDKCLAVSQEGGACRVQWSVEAKKLKGADKQAVSPPLEVSLGQGAPPATFKLMLCPSGGDSFRKAGGVGQVLLKCCSDLPEGSWPLTAVSISVGSGREARVPRGPFAHRFGSSSVFGAPRGQADWDFGAPLEPSAPVVTVTVEMAPGA